ncbi:MAG: DEAD/DEAH box helicase, partial [Candidatus Gracilibacteria bacterium]|nr:DEAD/DEAH box helicase [Candidatus Gracilibacteria bacterium]
ELVMQIGEVFAPYATNVNLKYTCIYGGVNDFHQIKAIEKGVDILIATPGRLEDLISQGVVKLSYVEILTIDEADRMLDLGFFPDVKKILKRMPQEKQIFFFSRTIPQTIKELANSILKTPEIITIKGNSKTVELANQEVYFLKTANKRQLLQQIIKRTDLKSIIVFVKTREDTDYIMSYVKSVNIKCDNIHKDKSQNARQNSIQALKTGKIKVLVGTDLASRGIDINDLSCVINYNIPSDPEDYIHRIGRTARAGKGGLAISMCAEDEKSNFEAIEKLIGKKIKVITDETYKSEIIQKSEFVQTIRKSSAKKTKKPKKNYSRNPYLGKSFDPNKVGKGKKVEEKNEKFSKGKINSKDKNQIKEKPQRKQYDNKKVVKADRRRKKGF